MAYDLSRFLNAQSLSYSTALTEIKEGRKRTHWIWFIFPQLKELGRSSTARFYGIEDLAEARAYLADDTLRSRLLEISQALLELADTNIRKIMGPLDDVKLRSCMTLFHLADPSCDVFQKVLDKYFGGMPDEKTLALCDAIWGKPPIICAPGNSVAHQFAVKNGYNHMPSDCMLTWDNETWLKKFYAADADYRALRREVWENTREIVEAGGYSLPDGDSVLLSDKKRYSQFYYKPFRASFERMGSPLEITVVPDDCLDVAHRWVEEAMRLKGECNDIAVLNMASRRNPGGGVTNGAGAQEEYLFRCSDYHKYLYRYASYAEQYNLTRSHYQYPLDENFGGILSQNVTVFRENEDTGYRLISKPWQVNMIAVAGMNSPQLVLENGEERIAPNLVEGVKNKIRTIFRIACDRGQRNLVLGALGCGAFHNPPKHVAELFRDVLCEEEFWGAFQKICFAVKTSHTSKGDTNFSAFKETLDGFVPVMKNDPPDKIFDIQIKKIAIARDSYALLMSNGQVRIVDIRTGESRESRRFRKSVDIAAGFHHIIGLREDGKVVFKSVGEQAPSYHGVHLFSGIAVYACEMHSAMLLRDGTVVGVDHSYSTGLEKISEKSSRMELMLASQEYLRQSSINAGIPKYKGIVDTWKNIKQVALTFEEPYALTQDGKILRGEHELEDFQDSSRGKIIQIAAFGCYYSAITIGRVSKTAILS